MRKLLILLTASTAFTAFAAAPSGGVQTAAGTVAPADAARPQIGTFGFDVPGMDRSVGPGDNFYRFANGTWEERTEIPADRSNYGMFTLLDDLSRTRTRAILEEAALAPGSRIGDFYTSFMDEAAIESAGITPLRPMMAKIEAVGDRGAWAAQLGELFRRGVTGPFAGYVSSDDRIPTEMIVRLTQSGLGLPDRDYYLRDEAALTEKRTAYQTYLARLLTLAGEENAEARAAAVLAFERGIAEVHWTRVENRDDERTYNKWARADFDRQAPGFAWTRFFESAGIADQPNLLVSQPSAFAGSAKLIGETPQAVLNDYLLLRLIDDAAPYLSRDYVDAHFAFHGTALNGTPQNEERWKRGVTLVTEMIPDEVSRIYVERHFPPEAKAAADELVRNIIAAMDRRLDGLAWMAPETRARARAKLAAFTPKIGYPDRWRDYSGVAVTRDKLVQNIFNATEFEYRRNLAKLGRPVDRGEWFMTPMTVNAYANPTWNEIVFPAAILQPPFFDPNADPAVNYGGIGAVIGHEISHHFDDQGSRYDQTGALREWWTPQDRQRFEALTGQLVAQYDQYEPLPGHRVQGRLTLGENIADLAGLTVAYDAYRLSLGGGEAPVLEGFTADQRFYLGWAQIWRRKYREENLLQRLLTDPHSPSEQRAAVVRNLDPWYAAFQPEAGDALYLSPEQRVRIW
ncbi:M13 family metallopeptidase [Sphingosinicella sp. CPCC 101087]|uniref:M13 family metallopeptidase n=1 Tax=Sphingosinicella sp. CPCC 101087 TaxID=2497754 RepID=UPI00101DA479|nr:M13 family metallopeptidase [Sphingosinicella sp. CPCC 101087]